MQVRDDDDLRHSGLFWRMGACFLDVVLEWGEVPRGAVVQESFDESDDGFRRCWMACLHKGRRDGCMPKEVPKESLPMSWGLVKLTNLRAPTISSEGRWTPLAPAPTTFCGCGWSPRAVNKVLGDFCAPFQ